MEQTLNICPDEVKEQIQIAVKNVAIQDGFGKLSWTPTNLIAKRQRENNMIWSKAFCAVLSDVLSMLENEEFQRILKGRFWQKHTQLEVAKELNLSVSAIAQKQANALARFVQILWEWEQSCIAATQIALHETIQTAIDHTETLQLLNSPETKTNQQSPIYLAVASLTQHEAIGIVNKSPLIATSLQSPIKRRYKFFAIVIFLGITLLYGMGMQDFYARKLLITPSTPILDSSACDGNRKSIKDQFVFAEVGAAFTTITTNGVIPNDKIRTMATTRNGRGLWLAYFKTDQNPASGLAYFDNDILEICKLPDELQGININAIKVDRHDHLWLATEGGGVALYDGVTWTLFTKKGKHLPSNLTYSLTIDNEDDIWVSTQMGIAEYDGTEWRTHFSIDNGILQYEGIHKVAFAKNLDIWIGYIEHGIRRFDAQKQTWVSYTTINGLSGNDIRDILIQQNNQREIIWFATADGGITRFQNEQWMVYNEIHGLPSNKVQALAVDKFNRVWAATEKGVAYFENDHWNIYNHLSTFSIVFGALPKADCPRCSFADDDIWTGTESSGFTHARIPLQNDAITINTICMVLVATNDSICEKLSYDFDTQVVTVTLTRPFTSGEEFRLHTTVTPHASFQLKEGDLLKNTDGNLYGAWTHVAIDKDAVVHYGTPYTFKTNERPFKAPSLNYGETKKTFITTWRVWMDGRFVGPLIRVMFIVKN